MSGKRFQPKFKIKKGDKVLVITGNSKGTTGEVLEVFTAKSRIIVEGANLVKKHQKPTNDSPGGIVEVAASIHISNVKLVDPKSGTPTRVGRRVENGKIVRFSKSSGETIK